MGKLLVAPVAASVSLTAVVKQAGRATGARKLRTPTAPVRVLTNLTLCMAREDTSHGGERRFFELHDFLGFGNRLWIIPLTPIF